MSVFFKWVVIGWSILMLLFFCSGVFNVLSTPLEPPQTDQTRAVALVMAAGLYSFVWGIVAVPAAILWRVTKS